eukprot:11229625-Ditylum_brightwellii.AAC.1
MVWGNYSVRKLDVFPDALCLEGLLIGPVLEEVCHEGGSNAAPLAELDDWQGSPFVCIPAKCKVGPSYLALVLDELFVALPGKFGRGDLTHSGVLVLKGGTGYRETAVDISGYDLLKVAV